MCLNANDDIWHIWWIVMLCSDIQIITASIRKLHYSKMDMLVTTIATIASSVTENTITEFRVSELSGI